MMKSDDPRLIESHKRLTEEVKKLDDMIVTVLKYHVSVERSMVELIEAHGKKAADTFSEKIKQREALNPPEIDAATWELLKKANRLRNGRQYPGAAAGRTVSLIRSQPYQPSPKGGSGRPAHHPFRGLLGVHSRYGLHTRAVTVYRDTLTRGVSHFVASMTAPVASGWSGCRVGLTPTGKHRLFTAHPQSGFSTLIRRTNLRSSVSICGRPPRGRDFRRQ
jgi:hypothetical protein